MRHVIPLSQEWQEEDCMYKSSCSRITKLSCSHQKKGENFLRKSCVYLNWVLTLVSVFSLRLTWSSSHSRSNDVLLFFTVHSSQHHHLRHDASLPFYFYFHLLWICLFIHPGMLNVVWFDVELKGSLSVWWRKQEKNTGRVFHERQETTPWVEKKSLQE